MAYETFESNPNVTETVKGVYGDGKFIIMSTRTNKVRVSTDDGATWQPYTRPLTSGPIIELAYGNGVFVAVSNESSGFNAVIRSTNGTTWTAAPFALNGILSLTFAGGFFVITISSFGSTYYSADGITWTASKRTGTSFFDPRIQYRDGYYLACNRRYVSNTPSPVLRQTNNIAGSTIDSWAAFTGPFTFPEYTRSSSVTDLFLFTHNTGIVTASGPADSLLWDRAFYAEGGIASGSVANAKWGETIIYDNKYMTFTMADATSQPRIRISPDLENATFLTIPIAEPVFPELDSRVMVGDNAIVYMGYVSDGFDTVTAFGIRGVAEAIPNTTFWEGLIGTSQY